MRPIRKKETKTGAAATISFLYFLFYLIRHSFVSLWADQGKEKWKSWPPLSRFLSFLWSSSFLIEILWLTTNKKGKKVREIKFLLWSCLWSVNADHAVIERSSPFHGRVRFTSYNSNKRNYFLIYFFSLSGPAAAQRSINIEARQEKEIKENKVPLKRDLVAGWHANAWSEGLDFVHHQGHL